MKHVSGMGDCGNLSTLGRGLFEVCVYFEGPFEACAFFQLGQGHGTEG